MNEDKTLLINHEDDKSMENELPNRYNPSVAKERLESRLNTFERLESRLNSRDNILKEKLASSMKAEKEYMENEQYKGVIGAILKFVGYKAKPVNDDIVLENVLSKLVTSVEQMVEKNKYLREQVKETLEERRVAYLTKRAIDQNMHNCEAGFNLLSSLKEDLSKTTTTRESYLSQKFKKGYNGEVDHLLTDVQTQIDTLFKKKELTTISIIQSMSKIVHYNTSLEIVDKKIKESEAYYETRDRNYICAMLIFGRLAEIKHNKSERDSLLKMYSDISKERNYLISKTMPVTETGKKLLAEIMDAIYSESVKDPIVKSAFCLGLKLAST
jgi:hypothetical protein